MIKNIHNFYAHIDRKTCLNIYRGLIREFTVTSQEGKTIRLAADHFIPFMTESGVSGTFCLTVNEYNKKISLKQI